jgi:hypothetical protein
MKASYKVNDNLSIELEAEKLTNLLVQVSNVNSALEPEECGKCECTNTFPRVREVGTDTFFEIQCKECWAVLQLGVHKEGGTLYKKLMKTDSKGRAVKDDNDKPVYLQDKGWLKWDKEKKQMV